MSRNFFMIISNDSRDANLVKQAIVADYPFAKCLCFQNGNEALYAIASELKHFPACTFFFSNGAGVNTNDYLKEFRARFSSDESKVAILSDVVPQSVANIFLSNGAAFVFQKPNNRSDAKYIVRTVLDNTVGKDK